MHYLPGLIAAPRLSAGSSAVLLVATRVNSKPLIAHGRLHPKFPQVDEDVHHSAESED